MSRARSLSHLWFMAAAACWAACSAHAQTAGHHVHPPMPGQKYYVQCRANAAGGPLAVELPLDIPSLNRESKLDQVIRLAASWPEVRLTQYWPRASVSQNVEAAGGDQARPAVLISINGPKQSFQRWLVAGDNQRNRLVSFIATWRFMSVDSRRERDTLLKQFKNELTRQPLVRLSSTDGKRTRDIPATRGQALKWPDSGHRLQVLDFYPHFAIDKKSGKPSNQSNERLNPAALVEVEHRGAKEQVWVFAKFPEFNSGQLEGLPFRITLDCPTASKSKVPDFLVLGSPDQKLEVWDRHEGALKVHRIGVNDKIKITGSQYAFHVGQYIPRGVLIETYAPTDSKSGFPVVKGEVTHRNATRETVWLPLGKPLVLSTPEGPMTLAFGPRQEPKTGGHP